MLTIAKQATKRSRTRGSRKSQQKRNTMLVQPPPNRTLSAQAEKIRPQHRVYPTMIKRTRPRMQRSRKTTTTRVQRPPNHTFSLRQEGMSHRIYPTIPTMIKQARLRTEMSLGNQQRRNPLKPAPPRDKPHPHGLPHLHRLPPKKEKVRTLHQSPKTTPRASPRETSPRARSRQARGSRAGWKTRQMPR